MRLKLSERVFVTPVRMAVTISSSRREIVRASVASSVTCSFCAHQS